MPNNILNVSKTDNSVKNEVLLVVVVSTCIVFMQLFLCKTIAVRLVSMLLIAVGCPNAQIETLVGSSKKTIRDLRKKIYEATPDQMHTILSIKPGSGRKPKTKDSIEKQIVNDVCSNRYSSLRQICDMILKKFRIVISKMSVSRLLKKFSIKKRKCGSLPAKADPLKQKEFYDETLMPLMKEAKEGISNLFFFDASHFVMGCDFLGCFYGIARIFVRTLSGRRRYNVLGAINFITKKVTTVTNDKYITAPQVCELFKLLANEYKDKVIHIILDNAKYQKCRLVEEALKLYNKRIVLHYLPAYSPNLNLIERFWKFVKSELRIASYDDFGKFSKEIDNIIASSSKENKGRIDTLIGERVQLYTEILDEQAKMNAA